MPSLRSRSARSGPGGIHFARVIGGEPELIGGGGGFRKIPARQYQMDARVLRQRRADPAAEESIGAQNEDFLNGWRHAGCYFCVA